MPFLPRLHPSVQNLRMQMCALNPGVTNVGIDTELQSIRSRFSLLSEGFRHRIFGWSVANVARFGNLAGFRK